VNRRADASGSEVAVLTISQLARFVGVTVRAVRHYHESGLLLEPDRDASGYRRYDGQAVVDLIRIKRLADAGVPLSRVSGLLHAEPERFAEAIEEIDANLRARIRELQRQRVAELVAGDRLVLPTEVVDYLDRLRETGVSERGVGMERDGWILLAVHSPDLVAKWVKLKQHSLDDPDLRALYLLFDQAFEWQPDDPRLPALADTLREYLTRNKAEEEWAAAELDAAAVDRNVLALLDSQTANVSPAWKRLAALVAASPPGAA
jgi:DNA-binding transcriptional MerR regulator